MKLYGSLAVARRENLHLRHCRAFEIYAEVVYSYIAAVNHHYGREFAVKHKHRAVALDCQSVEILYEQCNDMLLRFVFGFGGGVGYKTSASRRMLCVYIVASVVKDQHTRSLLATGGKGALQCFGGIFAGVGLHAELRYTERVAVHTFAGVL